MGKSTSKRDFLWLLVMVFVDLCFIFYGASGLSISYKEAVILYELKTPLHYFVKASCDIFGYNDFALRAPFVLLHFINIFLLYFICEKFFKKHSDVLICVFIYMLLPGVNTAALVVNEASLTIFFTLLFILSYKAKMYAPSYLILITALGVDNSFIMLYLALFFYGITKKDKMLVFLCLALFLISMYIYGFETHGKPKGHFLDTIGVYAATFSPLVMLYYVYTLYRIAVKERKNILWFIGFCAFLVTLIFSLRQRLALEDFLPFAVICVPLMVKTFLNSYRVRLPINRSLHKLSFVLVFLSLFASFSIIMANKIVYAVQKNPKKHFAYKYNVAKELSLWLHERNIDNIYIKDKKLRLRLKFYGIISGNKFKLVKLKLHDGSKNDFVLDYFSRPVARYKVIPNDI